MYKRTSQQIYTSNKSVYIDQNGDVRPGLCKSHSKDIPLHHAAHLIGDKVRRPAPACTPACAPACAPKPAETDQASESEPPSPPDREITFMSADENHLSGTATDPHARIRRRSSYCNKVPADMKLWTKHSFLDRQVAIIVSDMTGFTRLTRAHGIIHFASIILRMRQLCLPIFHQHLCLHIATEADNFIVVFPTASAAVLAAIGMQRVVSKYNNSLSADQKHFSVTLNGVGVAFGKGPLVDVHDKLYGRTFSTAYALGEDLCAKGDVLITGSVKSELEKDCQFSDAVFRPKSFEDDAENREVAAEIAERSLGLFDIGMKLPEDPVVPDPSDDTFLDTRLLALTKRHAASLTQAELQTMDSDIRSQHMVQRTVLMFMFEHFEIDDEETLVRLELECLSSLGDIFESYDVDCEEDVLYMFTDPVDAVRAAQLIRSRLAENGSPREGPRVQISGYGVHLGEVLFFTETDVHWGDPINTASKLGQDLATDGDIIISGDTYKAVKDDSRMQDVSFTLKMLSKSNVLFETYSVVSLSEAKAAEEVKSSWWERLTRNVFCLCKPDSYETVR